MGVRIDAYAVAMPALEGCRRLAVMTFIDS
jgi:hypothetical protein